jgi:hypothetical protein
MVTKTENYRYLSRDDRVRDLGRDHGDRDHGDRDDRDLGRDHGDRDDRDRDRASRSRYTPSWVGLGEEIHLNRASIYIYILWFGLG